MKNQIKSLRIILFMSIFLVTGNSAYPQGVKKVDDQIQQLKFKHFSFVDQQGTGLEVFRFLIPVDWKFEGGINWILDNPAMPVTIPFRVYNTKGKDEFEAFANRCFFWTTNLGLLSMFPPGTKYFGSTVKLPVNAQTALKQIIVPDERRGYQNFKIISQRDLPELAEALGAGKQAQGFGSSKATGAKMRFSYVKNGTEMEEEIYAVVEKMTFPVKSTKGLFFNTIWFVDYIFSFKGEKGKLEDQTKNFQTITLILPAQSPVVCQIQQCD